MTPEDQHGPSWGCNYTRCGHPGTPCPFVKDVEPVVKSTELEVDGCGTTRTFHEWRQLQGNPEYGYPKPETFYCIYCLCMSDK